MNKIMEFGVTKVPKTSMDITEERLQQLKDVFPEVFTEGKIDFDALKMALGENVTTNRERYQFTWSGKSHSIRLVQVPSRATLIPMRDESINFDQTQNAFIEVDNLEV